MRGPLPTRRTNAFHLCVLCLCHWTQAELCWLVSLLLISIGLPISVAVLFQFYFICCCWLCSSFLVACLFQKHTCKLLLALPGPSQAFGWMWALGTWSWDICRFLCANTPSTKSLYKKPWLQSAPASVWQQLLASKVIAEMKPNTPTFSPSLLSFPLSVSFHSFLTWMHLLSSCDACNTLYPLQLSLGTAWRWWFHPIASDRQQLGNSLLLIHISDSYHSTHTVPYM